MGVHGLWDIVAPSARPVRVEALRNKKLAVDASIWIYQFLKAVRDSEGNQLKNSHVIGFFRRICKLLFLGIKPVFVFDGGVPALKRDTIRKRREKREGNKESIEQTAQRILAQQLQLYADGKLSNNSAKFNNRVIKSSPEVKTSSTAVRKEKPTNGLYFDVYYDDLVDEETHEEPHNDQNLTDDKVPENESKMFRKQDDYDLPVLKGGLRVEENDNRVTTDYEYDRLTKDISDDLDNVDLDHINPQSKEFSNLPLSTQYIVLSHLRLRSRLRMGYSKNQLQSLFPDPMEFSKFQIKMVQKRNFFTQKIMNVTGMDGDANEEIISRRIASDKNRAYNLKRTGDGYALTLSKELIVDGMKEKPVILDNELMGLNPNIQDIDSDEGDNSNDDIDWNDVEVMGEKEVKEKQLKPKSVEVENPLFVIDSDEEVSESDEGSIELEDVTEAKPVNSDENDEIMKQIQYLYEYSEKNNKNKQKKDRSLEPRVILSDDDMDEFHQIQLKQIEDEELKEAIEKSKRDYLTTLNKEKEGITTEDSLDDEMPIILSTSTLAKTLNLPNFSMKNNLLFGGGDSTRQTKEPIKQNDKIKQLDFSHLDNLEKEEVAENKEEEEEKEEEKPKCLPLPVWFGNHTSFDSESNKEMQIEPKKKITEDEKAGLVSYGEIANYFSSDDENDFDFIDVTNKTDTNNKEKPIIVEDLDAKTSNKNEPILIDEDELPQGVQEDDKHIISDPITIPELEGVVDNIELNQEAFQEERKEEVKEQENGDKKEEKESIQESTEQVGDNKGESELLKDILTGKTKEAEDDTDFEFSDDEDVSLLLGMEEENKSYDKFINKIKGNPTNINGWTFADEARLQEQLKKQKRDSDEVSTKMIYDVQDLLARFGIPFITAPMEAEAQCAELRMLGLVDGIITDDSDCFLFGGDKIYKNLFSDKNMVECYQDDDIRAELGLYRNTMIELAILLGSDYTEGIKGVGKVTAMEILGEFKNLENFKNWWINYQNGIIDESKDSSVRKKLRKSLGKNLFLNADFPNKLIFQAYIHPEVDHDKTEFKWGFPDLDKLRTFLRFYARWNQEKVDEILIPVIENMNKPQSTINEFFPVEMIQRRRKLNMSKRIKDATDKLKKSKTLNSTDDDGPETSLSKRQKT